MSHVTDSIVLSHLYETNIEQCWLQAIALDDYLRVRTWPYSLSSTFVRHSKLLQ